MRQVVMHAVSIFCLVTGGAVAASQPGAPTATQSAVAPDTAAPLDETLIPTPMPPDVDGWAEGDEVRLHRDRVLDGTYYVRSSRYRFGPDARWYLLDNTFERHDALPSGCERTPCVPAMSPPGH